MDNINAGIITYNPDIEQLKMNIIAIQSQVKNILIVDNASQNYKEILELKSTVNNIIIIKNEDNYGIGKALNQLLKYSDEMGKDWLLTLDQDSTPPENMIKSYVKYLGGDIGIISPNVKDVNDKANEVVDEENIIEVEEAITSGSLLNIKLSLKLGGFDESMFIDFVDFEYCVRVRKAGYKILRVNKVVLIHQLGDLNVKIFFNRSINVTNHSEIRQYYYAKNNIYMYLKHKDYVSLKTTVLRAVKQIVKVVIFESSKKKKLVCISKGNFQGLKNRIDKGEN